MPRPDPPAQWAFRRLAGTAVEGGAEAARARAVLDSAFTTWLSLAPAIEALAAHAPLVRDARPAAEALRRLAEIATEALGQLAKGSAGAEWVKAKSAELDRLAEPQGLLRITVIPAVRILVEGAGSR